MRGKGVEKEEKTTCEKGKTNSAFPLCMATVDTPLVHHHGKSFSVLEHTEKASHKAVRRVLLWRGVLRGAKGLVEQAPSHLWC